MSAYDTNRYEEAVEKCGCDPFNFVGFVRGGDPGFSGDHASTMVCISETHQAAAREWVRSKGFDPYFVPRQKPGQ